MNDNLVRFLEIAEYVNGLYKSSPKDVCTYNSMRFKACAYSFMQMGAIADLVTNRNMTDKLPKSLASKLSNLYAFRCVLAHQTESISMKSFESAIVASLLEVTSMIEDYLLFK